MVATFKGYDTTIDTSGWIAGGISGTSGVISCSRAAILGTNFDYIPLATVGNSLHGIVFDGDIATSTSTLANVSMGSPVINGDTIIVNGSPGSTMHMTYTSDGSNISNPYIVVESAESKKARINQSLVRQMKSNLRLGGFSRQISILNKVSPQEDKARASLRDLISEREWRRYMTNGFVIVKATSGRSYQIFNDQRHIKVYVKGKLSSEICIHTDSSCPKTDHILNIMSLIEHDENLIWTKGIGNVYHKENILRTNAIYSNGELTTLMDGFLASGEDVPVEQIRHINLMDSLRRMRVA